MSENKHTPNFEELCAGYVLNSLTQKEMDAFLEMLDTATSQNRQLFQDMKTIASEMALLYPQEEPSSQIRKELIDMAWASVHMSQGTNIHYLSRLRLAAVASILFMITALGLFFHTQNLNQEISKQQITIRALETEVEQKEELLTILEARDVDLILMNGLDVNPNGYGKIVWDKNNNQALLQVSNLPSVPSDKDYQLWFIIDDQPTSAGVFAVQDPTRDNFFKVEELNGEVTSGAFAITLEPKGGVPQPTGEMYMLGSTLTN